MKKRKKMTEATERAARSTQVANDTAAKRKRERKEIPLHVASATTHRKRHKYCIAENTAPAPFILASIIPLLHIVVSRFFALFLSFIFHFAHQQNVNLSCFGARRFYLLFLFMKIDNVITYRCTHKRLVMRKKNIVIHDWMSDDLALIDITLALLRTRWCHDLMSWNDHNNLDSLEWSSMASVTVAAPAKSWNIQLSKLIHCRFRIIFFSSLCFDRFRQSATKRIMTCRVNEIERNRSTIYRIKNWLHI